MGRPYIRDINTLLQAGVDPKTGLPLKMINTEEGLKENLRANFRILDECDAINRYQWVNLPDGLTGELLERVLYYRGAGAFFKLNDKYFFLPYALNGTIDVYGRFTGITPLPFNGTVSDGKEKPWIVGLTRKPQYFVSADPVDASKQDELCVLLSDYNKQISQTVLPRSILQEPIIDTMSNLVPYMNTALITSTGIKGIRVNGDDEQDQVNALSKQLKQKALNADPWIAINSDLEMQELTNGTTMKAEDFMIALEELDNLRLSMYGLDNGGIYNKKTVVTDTQMAMNQSSNSLPYQAGLNLRREFCDIVNDIFDLGIWVQESECVMGIDKNMDGESDLGTPSVESEGENDNDTNA